MNRRAQGMSINVVVIAAICLIILVILILIVVNKSKAISNTTGEGSCLAQGGQCMQTCPPVDNPANYENVYGGTSKYCQDQNPSTPYCCRYKFGG